MRSSVPDELGDLGVLSLELSWGVFWGDGLLVPSGSGGTGCTAVAAFLAAARVTRFGVSSVLSRKVVHAIHCRTREVRYTSALLPFRDTYIRGEKEFYYFPINEGRERLTQNVYS